MTRKLLPLLLLVLATLIGGGAWLILSSDTAEPPKPPMQADGSHDSDPIADAEAPPGQPATERARRAANDAGSVVKPDVHRPDNSSPQPGNTGAESGGPDRAQPGRSQPMGAAASAQLTPQQLEEQARKNGTRAQHNANVSNAPMIGSALAGPLSERFKKPLEAEKWIEAFKKEGLEPPDMIPTPVAGKIMSPVSREGLADTRVVLFSFLPWAGRQGGELYPVVTELKTDSAGEFKGDVPAPPRAPQGHPPLGMMVTARQYDSLTERMLITGMAIQTVEPGRFNQLGIFWAPETLFEVECDARTYSGVSKSVTCTGALNPARWYEPKRSDMVFLFGPEAIQPDGAGEMAGKCLLRGTWSPGVLPFLTLVDGKSAIQTRRCELALRNDGLGVGTPAAQVRTFKPVVFDPANAGIIAGRVTDAAGAPVANAMLTTMGDPTPASTLTDAGGWFEIADPGKAVTALRITHDDFITFDQTGVKPGDTALAITLPQRKPVLWFSLRDRLTQALITDVSVKLIERIETKGGGKKPAPRTATVELASQTGEFVHKAEFLVNAIVLEKVGYFPRTINDPITQQAQAGGRLDILLNPGRQLEVKPRQHTAAQDTGRWTPDANDGPGITTYWSNHWIEWQVDFGEAPQQGEEGGSFDMLLGCTNSGLVDNNYKFEVDVYVDGTRKGRLNILANTVAIQTGRMALGKLSGLHTVRLVWLNDKWIPDQLDANIRYASLKFIEQP